MCKVQLTQRLNRPKRDFKGPWGESHKTFLL
jgi:hypothetical protein